MGWEWHDRYRNELGQFERRPDGSAGKVPMCIKISEDVAEALRKRACEAKREIGDYVRDALLAFWDSFS